ALILAVVLGLLRIFVKPLLILFTLPVTVFTLGLFLLVINALIILIADHLVKGFHVDGFWYALLFSILLSMFQSAFNQVLENKKSYK
ncbi:MAG: phage holin family protein, partial [Flavobacteriaceae bacterium]|nr:phage holin family protein [Flavobacteriaceae bacterium]